MVSLTAIVVMHCFHNTLKSVLYKARNLFFAEISVMGKAEGGGEKWHGHVTALTVAPEFRRLGLAGKLMNNLEQISEQYVFL